MPLSFAAMRKQGRVGSALSADKKAVETAKMRELALQLRKDGYSYERIGHMIGTQFNRHALTLAYVSKLVKDAIKSIYREDAMALVKLEMERLDDMQLEALDVLRKEHVMVSGGNIVHANVKGEDGRYIMDPVTGLPVSLPLRDDGPRLAAIDRLLKIQERRARLLGLDKPTKVASTNPEGTKPAAPYVIQATQQDMDL